MLKKIAQDIKKYKSVYLMAVPVLLFYIIFCYVPMAGLVMAFQDFRPSQGILGSSFIGIRHFTDFFKDINFTRLMRNTFLLNVYDIIVGFPMPIILALLLNEIKNKGMMKIYQSSMFLPYFLSWVVVSYCVFAFLNPEKG